MDLELKMDVSTKFVLHWNCRGFTELPEALRHGETVEEIYLKWNNLTFLPTWLGSLPSLTDLYIPYNLLTSLPDEIAHLVSLTVLDVSHNRLRELPTSFCLLSRLTTLSINNNHLKTLPQDLYKMKCLQKLEASSNLIHFLPSRLDLCPSLREIVLDNNQLQCLPNTIVYLPQLEVLCISGNDFRYLPAVPFACRPYLRFNNNPALNYIPYQLGQTLTGQSDLKIVGDLWDLNNKGCFMYPPEPPLQSLNMPNTIISYGGHSLALPFPIRTAIPSTQVEVVPLKEMALRVSYNLGFDYFGFRIPRKPKLFKVLPNLLHQELKQGPASFCQSEICRKPVFEFAVIWVVPMCSTNHDRQGVSCVLSVLFFCSADCSRTYAHSQTSLNARQVIWRTLNPVSIMCFKS